MEHDFCHRLRQCHKRVIEDHFDNISADLRNNLEQAGKMTILEDTEKISEMANFAYVRQKGLYGNATPLLNVEHLIGDEPFIYAFADDFIKATPSDFAQMVALYNEVGGSVIACVKAKSDDDYARYGFIGGTPLRPHVTDVNAIIEKPGSKALAPSDIASVGGYIFDPVIFKYLHESKKMLQKGSEFNQQVGMQNMLNDGHKMYGLEIPDGTYYDTGNKLEYLKTVVDFALEHPELGDDFKQYLRTKL